MRRRTFTVFPAILAAETILSKSNSLSTLTKTPLSAARTKSSSNFPFPLKMHLPIKISTQYTQCYPSSKSESIHTVIKPTGKIISYPLALINGNKKQRPKLARIVIRGRISKLQGKKTIKIIA